MRLKSGPENTGLVASACRLWEMFQYWARASERASSLSNLLPACRQSATTFYVIGLYSRFPRIADDPVHACNWQSGNGTHLVLDPSNAGINASAVVHYIKRDEHNVPYAIAVVKCEFPEAVGGDGRGGLLSLWIPTFSFRRVSAARAPGALPVDG